MLLKELEITTNKVLLNIESETTITLERLNKENAIVKYGELLVEQSELMKEPSYNRKDKDKNLITFIKLINKDLGNNIKTTTVEKV